MMHVTDFWSDLKRQANGQIAQQHVSINNYLTKVLKRSYTFIINLKTKHLLE